MTVVSNTSEALNSPYTKALEHMLANPRARPRFQRQRN